MLNDKNNEAIEIIDNFLKLVDIHDKGYEVNVHMDYSKQGIKVFRIYISDPTYKSKTGNTKCYGNVKSDTLSDALRVIISCNFDGKSYIVFDKRKVKNG